VDQVVPLLPHGIVVEHKHGERQIVTDGRMEIGHVHHESCICRDVSDPLARSRKTGAQGDAQALPDRPKSSPSDQFSALGLLRALQVTIAAWPPSKTRMRSRLGSFSSK